MIERGSKSLTVIFLRLYNTVSKQIKGISSVQVSRRPNRHHQLSIASLLLA